MRTIPLTQGKFALIDAEDFERVSGFKWTLMKSINNFYAYRKGNINGKYQSILLHRFILNLNPEDPHVDHRDRNGLNCQKYNLRNATKAQNAWNCRITAVKTSKFRGVTYCKRDKLW